MSLAVIIDIAVVLVWAGFCLLGAKRGLFRTVVGLVILVVSLIGAGMVATTFADPVAGALEPLLEKRIEQKIDDAVEKQKEELPDVPSDGSVQHLLDLLGLDEDFRSALAQRAEESVKSAGVSAATAVTKSMVHSLVYQVLFLVSFLVLTVVLNILAKAMDLLTKLPVVHGLNALGGGLVGAVEGALLLFLAVWVLRRFGASFDSPEFADAHILRIFTMNTPLSVLSFLK